VEKRSVKRILAGLVVAALLLGAVLAFFAWEYRAELASGLAQARAAADVWLAHVSPLVFFSLMAVLPVVPVPVSPFYLGCGIFPLPVALAGILIAIPVNFAITYWLVKTLMKPLAERLLARAGKTIPKPSTDKNEVLFCILIRVCGTPYTLQNYIIPLAGVKFRRYMLLGLPFQYIPAIAMMLVGDSLLKGEAGKAALGIGLLVAVGILAKFAKDRLAGKKLPQTEAATDA
jgi:uncharacterized membrane protein YdjX (TVP38/TMEM64 family)